MPTDVTGETSLTEALAKGVEALGELPEFRGEEILEDPQSRPRPRQVPETKPTTITEITEEVDDTTTEEEPTEQELTDEEVNNAKILFKALNNPKTQKASLQFLYQSLGVELPSITSTTTKTEVKEQTKDIIEQMKEAAPGLEFLIDKIGPIIKAELDKVREETQATVEVDRAERANKELQTESSKALTSVAQKFKYENNTIPTNILKEMTTMMNKVQPSPDLKPIEYITMLHDAARGKLGLSSQQRQQTQQQRTQSPTSRLASERVTPTSTLRSTPKKMSLNESIMAAVDELSPG